MRKTQITGRTRTTIETVSLLASLSMRVDSLKEDLDQMCKAVALRVLKAKRFAKGQGIDKDNISFESWYVDTGDVEIDWCETWPYGGHEDGTTSFPTQFLYDDTALVAFEEKCKTDRETFVKETERKTRASKLRQIARLKAELE